GFWVRFRLGNEGSAGRGWNGRQDKGTGRQGDNVTERQRDGGTERSGASLFEFFDGSSEAGCMQLVGAPMVRRFPFIARREVREGHGKGDLRSGEWHGRETGHNREGSGRKDEGGRMKVVICHGSVVSCKNQ